MQVQEVISMLRWINEGDPRVQFNDSAVEQWHYALRTVDPAVAKQAVLEHVKQYEAIQVTPGAISKRAGYIKTSRDAGRRAIEASPKQSKVHPSSWRERNPADWDRLFEEGRRLGNEERRRATEARNGTESEHADWMAA